MDEVGCTDSGVRVDEGNVLGPAGESPASGTTTPAESAAMPFFDEVLVERLGGTACVGCSGKEITWVASLALVEQVSDSRLRWSYVAGADWSYVAGAEAVEQRLM